MKKKTNKKMHMANFYIAKEEWERLRKYCNKNGCPTYSSIIRESLSKFLDDKIQKQRHNPKGIFRKYYRLLFNNYKEVKIWRKKQ